MRSTLFAAAFTACLCLTAASPFGPAPKGPANNGKTCTVKALGNQKDDTPQILKAFDDCNNGGTVSFPEGQNYWIATRLNPVIYDVTIDWQGIWTVSFSTLQKSSENLEANMPRCLITSHIGGTIRIQLLFRIIMQGS